MEQFWNDVMIVCGANAYSIKKMQSMWEVHAIKKKNDDIAYPITNNDAESFLHDPLQDAYYSFTYLGNDEEFFTETDLFHRVLEIIDDDEFDINQNIEQESGCTLLFIAMFFKHVELVKRLIEKGADMTILPDERSGDFWGEDQYANMTSLHGAVNSGNFEILQLVLQNGGDAYINEPVVIGPFFITGEKYIYPKMTPLQMACITGNVNAVHSLLHLGADKTKTLRAGDEYGEFTIYHLAMLSPNSDVITYLDPPMEIMMETLTEEAPLDMFQNAELWGLACVEEDWFEKNKEKAK